MDSKDDSFNLFMDLNCFMSNSKVFGPTLSISVSSDFKAFLLRLFLWWVIPNLWASLRMCWITFKLSERLSKYSGMVSSGKKISSKRLAMPSSGGNSPVAPVEWPDGSVWAGRAGYLSRCAPQSRRGAT